MKFLNLKDRRKKAWIEVGGPCHFRIANISPRISLGQAIFNYFNSIVPDPCPVDYNFLRVDCDCGIASIYEDPNDISDTFEDEGQLECPNCKSPWLHFKYEEYSPRHLYTTITVSGENSL